jgi:hypothetical protein
MLQKRNVVVVFLEDGEDSRERDGVHFDRSMFSGSGFWWRRNYRRTLVTWEQEGTPLVVAGKLLQKQPSQVSSVLDVFVEGYIRVHASRISTRWIIIDLEHLLS